MLPHHIAHKGSMNNNYFSSDHIGKTTVKNYGAVYEQYN